VKKGRCSICEKHGYINVHHLLPKSEGGSDHPSNLATVCLDCHAFLHEQIDAGIYYRWQMTTAGRTLGPPPGG
jgi:predicted HNH restriction endonuclease